MGVKQQLNLIAPQGSGVTAALTIIAQIAHILLPEQINFSLTILSDIEKKILKITITCDFSFSYMERESDCIFSMLP